MIESIVVESISDGTTLPMGMDGAQEYWLTEVDWGQAEGSHITYSMANQQGETIVSTSLLSRPLSITGWVIEDSTPLRTKCNFLNQFISPSKDYLLKYESYQIQFRPDTSVKYGREHTVNNVKMRQFLIQGTCPQPFFSSIVPITTLFDFSTKRFRFPTTFGQREPLIFATTDKVYNTRIFNPGGYSSGVIIQIDFIGNVTNPRIRDLQTNQLIGVDLSFVNGDRLTMVTIPGQKSMAARYSDQRVENVIKNRNVQTTWLQLSPGNNTWALECDDLSQRVNMDVQVMFTPLYLEVE